MNQDHIDQIKANLDIVQVIGEHVKLQKSGKVFRGLCPFHQEKTPSFTVWPATQTCHCFGCQAGGDVIWFEMKRRSLDFRTAIVELARQANVELAELTKDDLQANAARRATEDIYSSAAGYFTGLLGSNTAAMEYLRTRGLAQTIDNAMLGYYDGETRSLVKALTQAKVDLKHPVAMAITKIPADSIIYPHIKMGRVVYLSARSITGKRHYNLDSDLAGPKQPYYNHLWRPGSDRVVVVEGQADAITMGLWGLPAIALCGTDGKKIISELQRHKRIILALDGDQAGQDSIEAMASELAPLTQIVTWPTKVKDANELLQTGIDADKAQVLITTSPTWLDRLADQAIPCQGQEVAEEDKLRQVFLACCKLAPFDLGRLRPSLAERMKLSLETFDMLLKSTRREIGLDDHGRPRYEIIAGRMCHRSYDRLGNGSINPLADFSAWITSDVVSDDGENQTRSFTIEGKLADGTHLSKIEVEASEFSQMNWPLPRWGAKAVIAAGGATKDHLRAAILTLSKDIKTVSEYAHLGWRAVNGSNIYLSAAGGVGVDGIRVRLPNDMSAYKLPVRPANKFPAGGANERLAMQRSLAFLETGQRTITVALWAAAYLAPLSTILNPPFTIWIFGTTGSLKSTMTALMLSHYGKFSYNTPPASWTGTTNSIEKKAFLCKDAPLWIDDYTTQSTEHGMNEIQAKADQLLRDWGNRAGRSRMRADLSLRQTFYPRGLIISTAEQLPPGESIASRLFPVEISPDSIPRGEHSKLTQAQLHDAEFYPHAMAGYIQWLAPQLAGLEEALIERWLNYKEQAVQEGHARIPGNVAMMFIGSEMGLSYALQIGAIDQAEYARLRDMAWSTLNEIGQLQHQVISDKNPVEMYLSGLEQMFAQGKLYLRSIKNRESDQLIWPAIRTPQADHIGWYDELFWYLLPMAAFGAVAKFYRSAGIVFPDTERGVRAKLAEKGLLMVGDQRAYRVGGLPRVLRIHRPDIEHDDPSAEVGISGITGITGNEIS